MSNIPVGCEHFKSGSKYVKFTLTNNPQSFYSFPIRIPCLENPDSAINLDKTKIFSEVVGKFCSNCPLRQNHQCDPIVVNTTEKYYYLVVPRPSEGTPTFNIYNSITIRDPKLSLIPRNYQKLPLAV